MTHKKSLIFVDLESGQLMVNLFPRIWFGFDFNCQSINMNLISGKSKKVVEVYLPHCETE